MFLFGILRQRIKNKKKKEKDKFCNQQKKKNFFTFSFCFIFFVPLGNFESTFPNENKKKIKRMSSKSK